MRDRREQGEAGVGHLADAHTGGGESLLDLGQELLDGETEEQPARLFLQGEAVAFGADGAVFVAGEGGDKGLPGTLGVLSCRF